MVVANGIPASSRWARGTALAVVATILSLPLTTTGSMGALAVVILATTILYVGLLASPMGHDLARFTAASIVVFIAYLTCSDPRIVPGFNVRLTTLVATAAAPNRAIGPRGASILRNALVWLSGMLLSAIEANRLVTHILSKMKLGPTPVADQYELFSNRESGRGRVIGLLERSIVFALVVTGNVASIGILLAAKGLARFRELDSREFAEYVLIGTLLSVSCSVVVGSLMRTLLT